MRFRRLLEPAPPAHVVHQDGGEVGAPGLADVGDQGPEGVPAGHAQLSARVGISPHNLEPLPAGVYLRMTSSWLAVEYCWCSWTSGRTGPPARAGGASGGKGIVGARSGGGNGDAGILPGPGGTARATHVAAAWHFGPISRSNGGRSAPGRCHRRPRPDRPGRPPGAEPGAAWPRSGRLHPIGRPRPKRQPGACRRRRSCLAAGPGGRETESRGCCRKQLRFPERDGREVGSTTGSRGSAVGPSRAWTRKQVSRRGPARSAAQRPFQQVLVAWLTRPTAEGPNDFAAIRLHGTISGPAGGGACIQSAARRPPVGNGRPIRPPLRTTSALPPNGVHQANGPIACSTYSGNC